MKIRVGHLYPDYLNIYADRGNIAVLAARARLRAATSSRCARSGSATPVRPAHDLFYVGGGQDREQALVAPTSPPRRRAPRGGRGRRGVPRRLRRLPAPRPLLPRPRGRELPGIGLLPLHTIAGERRMIGDVLLECDWAGPRTLAGFENHAGRTLLDDGAEPLGRVVAGFGNDGAVGFRGLPRGQRDGTYLHGPLLPRNPWFADRLLGEALASARSLEPTRPTSSSARRTPSPPGARAVAAAALGGSGRPEGPEVDDRVAGLPACQEALDRRVQHDLVELVTAKSRAPRTAASSEVTSRASGRSRSPAKMMWTTCFCAKLRTGAIESTMATGPSTGTSSSRPPRAARAQRVDQRLTRVDAAAGQEPVLLAGLLVAAKEDAPVPAEDRRDADARLGTHQRPVEPCPPWPRSVESSCSTSSGSKSPIGSTTSWATRSPGSTTKVSSLSVFSRITLSSPR